MLFKLIAAAIKDHHVVAQQNGAMRHTFLPLDVSHQLFSIKPFLVTNKTLSVLCMGCCIGAPRNKWKPWIHNLIIIITYVHGRPGVLIYHIIIIQTNRGWQWCGFIPMLPGKKETRVSLYAIISCFSSWFYVWHVVVGILATCAL